MNGNRTIFFKLFILIVSLLFISRLFFLQIYDTSSQQLSANNILHLETVFPSRGIIVDVNGKIIVENQPVYDFYIIPNQLIISDTSFAIIKHNNACGIGSAFDVVSSYDLAFSADSLSAFGGVLISNKEVDVLSAKKMNTLFFEIIIAPSYQEKALTILKSKKNRIILVQKRTIKKERSYKSILNGRLEQDVDNIKNDDSNWDRVTKMIPSNRELKDLEFANKVVKHSKSNSIVLVKNLQMISSGVGQTSRIDALNFAIDKARRFGFSIKGSVMASDAFFPFPDCVEIAAKSGISSIIQPGGSIKDNLSIEMCDKNNISMVFSGIRHFYH